MGKFVLEHIKIQDLKPDYSLIIIGAGITGLSTAIAYAKNVDISANPVLVLEQNSVVGGMVTSFRRKGFLFDTAQIISDPLELFDYLGIDIKLKKYNGFYARIFLLKNGRTKEFRIPCGIENFRKMLIEKFSAEEKSIHDFFSYSVGLFEELKYLKLEPGFIDLIRILFCCSKTVKNSKKTFQEYLLKFGFQDRELLEIFDVFASFSGLPACRAVAMMTVAAMNTSLISSFRTEKGFIQLPLALQERAIELGCKIKTNSRVRKILIDNNQVRGVELENGEKINSEFVVTTADTGLAMEKLVGYDVLEKADKKYAEKARNVKMSASALIISLGLDSEINLKEKGFECGYNVLTTGGETFENLFKLFDRGEYKLDENEFHCAVICPSLVTGGKSVLMIRVVPMPMKNWKYLRDTDYKKYEVEKQKVADFYINQVEKYLIFDLKKHIVYTDIATPATFERYSGSPTGSNYDMAPYPENFGLRRLKTRTPIKGLFQPEFSHGIWPSMQAGLQVTDMLTGGKVMNGYSRYSAKK
ncbi:MAG: NAD(P)/FAD-dependent oxidoreductase [Prolixibacteraceae bacterium]|nr:NAD(P)/FAD-dependent oxidoreductase [Prolixibacteraceae bacterium]MBN2774650.1 NAD(P)/FAD-dependent oxidoreductase [Prolixibacteraceae bacterium]